MALKRMSLGADTVVPKELNMLIGFAKPSVIPAGLLFEDDRIEFYHTLDGGLYHCTYSREQYGTPAAAFAALLSGYAIERSNPGDTDIPAGKFVDFTSPSHAVNLVEVVPEVNVKGNRTMFDFHEVMDFVNNRYPGNVWIP